MEEGGYGIGRGGGRSQGKGWVGGREIRRWPEEEREQREEE